MFNYSEQFLFFIDKNLKIALFNFSLTAEELSRHMQEHITINSNSKVSYILRKEIFVRDLLLVTHDQGFHLFFISDQGIVVNFTDASLMK